MCGESFASSLNLAGALLSPLFIPLAIPFFERPFPLGRSFLLVFVQILKKISPPILKGLDCAPSIYRPRPIFLRSFRVSRPLRLFSGFQYEKFRLPSAASFFFLPVGRGPPSTVKFALSPPLTQSCPNASSERLPTQSPISPPLS